MPEFNPFARNDKLPSWFANRIQDFLSAAATDLALTRQDATHVQVVPREPFGIAAIDLEGRWRFVTAPVSRAMPGGAAGTFDVWAVGTDQNVDNVPDPFTDHTDYSFDLRITVTGTNPSGTGVVLFEKIGEVDWDGAAIAALRQTYGSVHGARLEDGAVLAGGAMTKSRNADGAIVLTDPGIAGDYKLSMETADHGIWLLADGRTGSQDEIEGWLGIGGSGRAAALFAKLGPTGPGAKFGAAPAGKVKLPDLRGRVPLGASPGGLGADRPTARAIGSTGGVESVALTPAQTAVKGHTHTVSDPGHGHPGSSSSTSISDPGHGHAGSTASTSISDPGHGHGVLVSTNLNRFATQQGGGATIQPYGDAGTVVAKGGGGNTSADATGVSASTSVSVVGAYTGISASSSVSIAPNTTGVSVNALADGANGALHENMMPNQVAGNWFVRI